MAKDPDELLEAVREILHRSGSPEARFLHDLMSTAVRFVRDHPDRGDMKLLSTAFKELRHGFRVFAPYRRIRKVSIFGSARTAPQEQAYKDAHSFATAMTNVGWMVITGAGPGIMEAAQGGAGRGRSFGVNIRLPFEQANPVIKDDPKLVSFKYFFTRKVVFVKETDAIVLFPGGFGTHDEAFESLTLVQTGKSQLLPIVFIDTGDGDYWKEWCAFINKHLGGGNYIGPDDLKLFRRTDDFEEAVRIILKFYSNYHSSRYVSGRLVMRLKKPVSDELLDGLNSEFGDVLTEGNIERIECHPCERREEPETQSTWRLGLWFDRKSVGRLRQMVDVINDDGGGTS